MRRFISLIVLFAFLCGSACAQYWESTFQRPVACCDDRPGCQVLQTVMMGSFAQFDPEDSLNVRVLSAALPRLAALTKDDFSHFCENFDVDREQLDELYFIALGNCLRSDIIVTPLTGDMDEQNARTVLKLFLVPPAGEYDVVQRKLIQENMTEEALCEIADNAGVPKQFVEYLLNENSFE